MDISNVYRWYWDAGGGLVIAKSIEEARNKIVRKFEHTDLKDNLESLAIWSWEDDDFYDENHSDVFDIY